MTERYSSVGKLGKPHGISGAFRFYLDTPFGKKGKVPKHFMIQTGGSYMPWFITTIEMLSKTEGIIAFEEITSREKAKGYTHHDLFLTEKEITVYFGVQKADDVGYVGYTAYDQESDLIGVIDEIVESPGQLLCQIKSGDKEILIPFVEDFILNIDKRKKEIIFNLPEGLLQL